MATKQTSVAGTARRTTRAGARPAARFTDAALALDQQLCFAVYSAMTGIARVYRPLLQELGVTYPQYLVLLVLWEEDGLTVSATGARLFLDSATLTPLLKRLQAAGLVTRARAARDERQVLVTLTPAGRALKDKARAIPGCLLAAMDCSVDEIGRLRNRIVSLRDRLLRSAA